MYSSISKQTVSELLILFAGGSWLKLAKPYLLSATFFLLFNWQINLGVVHGTNCQIKYSLSHLKEYIT